MGYPHWKDLPRTKGDPRTIEDFASDEGWGAGGVPSDTVVTEKAFGQSEAAGAGTKYSREDHTHGTPTDPVPAHAAIPDAHHAVHVKTLADHPLSIIPTMDDAHIPPEITRDTELAAHAALPDVHHAQDHHLRHEAGGADKVSVAGLSGELADPQPPKAHKTSHATGGSDVLSPADIGAIAKPASPAQGDILYYDGSNWVKLAKGTEDKFLQAGATIPGWAGGWVPVSEVDVAANCDYVDFTSLDINTDKFYILFMTVTNPQASNSLAYFFVNGDYTTTNYYRQYILGSGTSVTGARTNDPGLGNVEAGTEATWPVFIFRDPQGYARATSLCNKGDPAGITAFFVGIAKTATVENITSIRIAAQQSGGIGAGSKLVLCKPRS